MDEVGKRSLVTFSGFKKRVENREIGVGVLKKR